MLRGPQLLSRDGVRIVQGAGVLGCMKWVHGSYFLGLRFWVVSGGKSCTTEFNVLCWVFGWPKLSKHYAASILENKAQEQTQACNVQLPSFSKSHDFMCCAVLFGRTNLDMQRSAKNTAKHKTSCVVLSFLGRPCVTLWFFMLTFFSARSTHMYIWKNDFWGFFLA